MTIIDEPLDLSLPYTSAQMCYSRLESFPPIHQTFHDTLIPLAISAGDLSDRLTQIEARRQQALDDYLEAGNSLREVDTTLNCCIADLYVALFDTIGFKISESDLSVDDKLTAMQQLHDLLPKVLDWNPTKRTEISNLLRGTTAEIQLGE